MRRTTLGHRVTSFPASPCPPSVTLVSSAILASSTHVHRRQPISAMKQPLAFASHVPRVFLYLSHPYSLSLPSYLSSVAHLHIASRYSDICQALFSCPISLHLVFLCLVCTSLRITVSSVIDPSIHFVAGYRRPGCQT